MLPRIAVVGLGGQGTKYARAATHLARKGKVGRLAMCDPDPEARASQKQAADQVSVSFFASHQCLVQQFKPDVVFIAVPNAQYPDIVKACLQNGVSVVKEKPRVLSRKEAHLYDHLAQHSGAWWVVMQQALLSAHFRQARRWMRNGKIGVPIRFLYNHSLDDKEHSWYWSKDQGGGCWLNMGWHQCFMAHWFFSSPTITSIQRTSGTCREWTYDVDDTVHATLRTASGVEGQVHLTTVGKEKQYRFCIEGADGAIVIKRNRSVLQSSDGDVVSLDRFDEYKSAPYVQIMKDAIKRWRRDTQHRGKQYGDEQTDVFRKLKRTNALAAALVREGIKLSSN